MIERRKHERRHNQTIDLLSTWVGIGAVARIFIISFLLIIALWCAKTIFETILWLRVLLG